MKKTSVVNLHHSKFDVYIGRDGENLGWGNPYRIGRHGTRKEVLEKYRKYLMAQPELIERAKRTLKGKILGCYCKPKACHGDILVEVIES
jgi:hypothetical protein